MASQANDEKMMAFARISRLRFWSRHRPRAAMRSSIRSCSTSQYLSDDRTSLSISSVCANSASSIASGCNAPERLCDFCGLRLDFDVRHFVRFGLAAPINDSPSLVLFCWCFASQCGSGRDKMIRQPVNYDGQAKPDTSVSGFGADLGLWWGRRGARRAFGSRRSTPALPTASLCGRKLAKYCAPNARRAAMTVGPIPTIPSSMLGPSNAIQSSLRKSN